MKTDWAKAIAFVLRMEGGQEAELDPADPGGLTKFGISQKAYPNLDIRALTMDEAISIYHRDYWLPISGDDLPPALAIATFDCAVNQGVTKAKRILQLGLSVTVDGVIGPKTLEAAARAGRSATRRILAFRLAEYARLMAENKSLLVYAVNWSHRVISLADVLFTELEDGRAPA
jgi:lysozyme family protein